jgi:hypothetical protein
MHLAKPEGHERASRCHGIGADQGLGCLEASGRLERPDSSWRAERAPGGPCPHLRQPRFHGQGKPREGWLSVMGAAPPTSSPCKRLCRRAPGVPTRQAVCFVRGQCSKAPAGGHSTRMHHQMQLVRHRAPHFSNCCPLRQVRVLLAGLLMPRSERDKALPQLLDLKAQAAASQDEWVKAAAAMVGDFTGPLSLEELMASFPLVRHNLADARCGSAACTGITVLPLPFAVEPLRHRDALACTLLPSYVPAAGHLRMHHQDTTRRSSSCTCVLAGPIPQAGR